MAMNLKLGSSGSEVTKLQTALKDAGYDPGGIDGKFGQNTRSALVNYQRANGLSADGIAGAATQGKLYAAPSTAGTPGANAAGQKQEKPKSTAQLLQQYEQPLAAYKSPYADQIEEAKRAGQARLSQYDKPLAAYESPYAADIEAALDAWKNRKDFSYDFSADPAYQQYKEQYVNNGRRAMQDASAQAAGLTGGYGSSYAQQVGQQTYNDYLTRLNDVVPELRRQAYEQYAAEGDRQYQLLSALMDQDQTAYGRYRDEVGDRNAERNFLYNQYMDELDRLQAQDQTAYGQYRDLVGDQTNNRNYYYGKYRDERADELAEMAALAAASSGSGGRGGGRGGSGGSDKAVKQVSYDKALGEMAKALKNYGTASAQKIADDYFRGGNISEADYRKLLQYVNNQKAKAGGASSGGAGGAGGKWVAETK